MSGIVVQPERDTQLYTYYRIHRRVQPNRWYLHEDVTTHNRRYLDNHLLAMEQVAWYPRGRTPEIHDILKNVPMPLEMHQGSQIWVRNALTALTRANILSGAQLREATSIHDQILALPSMGAFPNHL
jgi:hypothetical protein